MAKVIYPKYGCVETICIDTVHDNRMHVWKALPGLTTHGRYHNGRTVHSRL
jgi:hypothetical protein